MNKKKIILPVVAVIVIAGALLLIFRKNLFSDTRDKLLNLIHLKKSLTVKDDTETINSHELLQKYFDHFGYEAKWTDTTSAHSAYRDMLLETLNQADSLGLNRAD